MIGKLYYQKFRTSRLHSSTATISIGQIKDNEVGICARDETCIKIISCKTRKKRSLGRYRSRKEKNTVKVLQGKRTHENTDWIELVRYKFQ
jgi:hypothetical protein